MAATRTTIRQDGSEVVLSYVDPLRNEPVVRRFWAPLNGGYVREVTDAKPGTLGDQVCDGLASRGYTLRVTSAEALLPCIRREWATLRRQMQREIAPRY